jgi:hypothetical protein
MTLTVTKIDSSQRGDKNFIIWAWLASTTIIYNDPVVLSAKFLPRMHDFNVFRLFHILIYSVFFYLVKLLFVIILFLSLQQICTLYYLLLL